RTSVRAACCCAIWRSSKRAINTFCLRLVLELRAFVLAGDNNRRTAVVGRVGEADRRVRRVDALPAMSAGAVDIDLEPFRVDGNVDLFGLRQDHDGGGRGVDATLRLGLGAALDPVHA